MSDKSFGVKQINLIGESGTPTIESPNNLNLNAIQVAISSDVSIGGEILSNAIVGSGYSIGIGTTQPQQSLDVSGTVRATNFVKSDGTPIVNVDSFWIQSASGGIYTSFNVGIGTTNPTEKLTVDGNANISGIVSANAFSLEISTKYGPTGINSTDAVTNIKAIRFDKEAAFKVTDLGNDEVLIGSDSTFKTWYVSGQPTLIASGLDEVEFIAGPGVAITTRNTATGVGTGEVKSLTFTSELVQETNPTLGADLDINNNNITGTGNININGIITATTFSGSGAGLTDIPTSAFQNAFVSYGGVTVSLGNSDPTPAFDLQDATGLPVSTGITGLGANVATFLATPSSSTLQAAVTDETGSGALVFNDSPQFINPGLGTPLSGTLTNCTGLPVSTGIAGLGANVVGFLTAPSSSTLQAAVTDETGSGALVFATSPTLITPVIGTPLSGTLTNCTGLPVSTGIAGLGANVATFLATPSSSNLAAAVTGETGSGALVFATSPTLVTPSLGAASATSINISGASTLGAASATSINISGASTISVNSTSNALRITQTGTGNALLVEDSTNPDSTPFVIDLNGNVGIGTISPVTTLDVNGIANIADITILNNLIYRPNGSLKLIGGGSGTTRNNIEFTNGGGLIIDGGSSELTGVQIKGGGGDVKVTQGNFLVGTGVTIYNNGDVSIGRSIYDSNNSTGSDGQILSNVTGFGVSWVDPAPSSGSFDTGITASIFASVTSGIGTAQSGLTTVQANNNIFIGPGIAYSFPSTAEKSYTIESIHVTNTYSNELYLTSRHDFNGGENVPTAQRVIVPYQGSVELLEQPIVAKPLDIIRLQAFAGVGTTATGIDGGLDAFIVYSEKDNTDYIGVGKTIVTPAGTEIFTSITNPSVVQSIRLCNYDLSIDVDASVSIYRGGTVGGILTTGVRQGYLTYKLTVPKNSVIEILERPKYLAANDTIVVGVAGSTLTNSLSATLSGIYIT